MTAEETQRLLDLLSDGNLGLSWVAHATIGIVALVGACFGAYLRKRGENYATKQDLEELTTIAEQIRAQVSDASWQGHFSDESKRLHDQLVADRDEYSYYSNLRKVAGETYDRMIVAAKTELSASLRRPNHALQSTCEDARASVALGQ